MKLENKVVLMAGAGSSAPGWSIGKASCVTLAKHGAVIVALDASLDAAQDAAEEVRKVGGKALAVQAEVTDQAAVGQRSEEHTSELQSLMRSSYAVFCLNEKTTNYNQHTKNNTACIEARHT